MFIKLLAPALLKRSLHFQKKCISWKTRRNLSYTSVTPPPSPSSKQYVVSEVNVLRTWWRWCPPPHTHTHRRGSVDAIKSGTEGIDKMGSAWTANHHSILQNKEMENHDERQPLLYFNERQWWRNQGPVLQQTTEHHGQEQRKGCDYAQGRFRTKRLLLMCQANQIVLRARHIPGRLNVLADILSRPAQMSGTERFLHASVFWALTREWGVALLDLFATRWYYKRPLSVSPVPDPSAMAVDALSMNWKALLAYAYPPPALLPRVLEKAQQDQCELILIAPHWPQTIWFPLLLGVLVQSPLRIPNLPRLLSQPRGLIHRDPSNLQLYAWRVSGYSVDVASHSRLHFSDRYKLSDWRVCARMHDKNIKSSMCSETTKHFWYKCHGLFGNSPVMIIVKSCLKCRSIQ